jgi:8-oxo-dGTP diphosphatase
MVEVSAGIITHGSEVLCFQKGIAKYPYLSNKWEFPGGKVEDGEDPKDTIIRELSEEIKVDMAGQRIIHLCDTEYDYPDFHVLMHSFVIHVDAICFELTEHIQSKWCDMCELRKLDWAEADKEIVARLEGYLEG